MTDLMVAGLSSGLVLAAMAAIAVLDARRAVVDPRLVLALLAAAAAWRYLGPGETGPGTAGGDGPWTPWIGMALGIAAAALPIAVAQWCGRRWPLYPGDAMMLGAFGFLLGPIGLAWTMLLGSALSLAYRVCLQRRRGRPIRKGLVPLGPGMAAGAAVVFLCVNSGVALAGAAAPHGAPAAAAAAVPAAVFPMADIAPAVDPLPATELAPAAAAPPETVAARELAFEQREAVPFPAAVRRLSSLSGIAVAIEERPSRIAGGTAILADAPPVRLAWRGALAGLLDRLAALSGYDWTWRDETVVFYRYWDIEQRPPSAGLQLPSGLGLQTHEAAAEGVWIVDAGAHKTLRGVLESWARQAGWTLVWHSTRDYAVEPGPEQAGRAVFHGGFLEAVDLLLAGDATRRALAALAYEANRHLAIEDAGGVGR